MDDRNEGCGRGNCNEQLRKNKFPEEDDNHGDFHSDDNFGKGLIDFFRKKEEELGFKNKQSSSKAGEVETRVSMQHDPDKVPAGFVDFLGKNGRSSSKASEVENWASMQHDPDKVRAGFIDFWRKNEELRFRNDQSSSKAGEVPTRALINKGVSGKHHIDAFGNVGNIGSSSGAGAGAGAGGSGGNVGLVVENLFFSTPQAEVEHELRKYGQVKHVKFVEERQSKVLCKVEFCDPADARACEKGMQGHVFNGHRCVLMRAQPPRNTSNRNQQMTQSRSRTRGKKRGTTSPGRGGRGIGLTLTPVPVLHSQPLLSSQMQSNIGGDIQRDNTRKRERS